MKGALVPEAGASDPPGRRGTVPLAKKDVVLGPRPSDLMLHPNAHQRR